MSSKQNGNRFTEEEMRIAKMISEGGLGVEAYYYMKEKNDAEDEEAHSSSNFVSLGGLGLGKATTQLDEEEKNNNP